MAASIEIERTDGETLTLDENVSLEWGRDIEKSPDGSGQSHVAQIVMRGLIKDADQEDIWDRMIEIEDFVKGAEGLGAVHIRFYVDGTLKREFDPAECFGSPILTGFRNFAEPGAGASFWRYEITARATFRLESSFDTPEDVYEFSSSLAITTDNDKVVRKVWAAAARAETGDAAEAAVRSFKPSGVKRGIKATVTRFNEEARATGVWVWELENEAGLEETIEELGFGTNEDYEPDPQVGKSASDRPDPNLVLLPKGPKLITVRGTVYGSEPILATPKPHYKDGPNMRSLRGRTRVFPTVVDLESGGFKRDFEEVYYCTSDSVPQADHGDHATGVKKNPPADGKL